jgi:hypothetical protein
MALSDLIFDPQSTPTSLAAYLDALTPAERLAQTLALGSKAQARLFDLVDGARRFTLDDLAPATGAPLVGVRHEGRNSMLAFTRFAKVFAVPEGVDPSNERWGFNATSALVSTTVGPGYFVAVPQGDAVLVDYTRLPSKPLHGAPPVLPNEARLSRFVYNQTKDLVRGVSQHVSIGRAWRGTRQLDNWFVLCRT